MLRFKQFIAEGFDYLFEAKKSDTTSDAAADENKNADNPKGVAYEIDTGNAIKGMTVGGEMTHHRANAREVGGREVGGHPKQVRKKIAGMIGPKASKQVKEHSTQAAEALINHLTKTGKIGGKSGNKVQDVFWTSNRDTVNKKGEKTSGDHHKTTGIHDPNSNADIIIRTKNTKTGKVDHVPMSLKYGVTKNPNYRNAGLDSLEKQAGVKEGTYTNIMKDHNAATEKMGYKGSQKERHAQYKLDVAQRKVSPKSKAAKRADAAEASSLESRKKIAAIHRTALSTKSDSELRDLIRSNVSAKTVIPHMVMHTHVASDGSVTHHIHDADHLVENHLAQHKDLHVKPNGDGISVTIHGTHKKTGKVVPVATQTIKASSGPHKGAAGTFSLPNAT